MIGGCSVMGIDGSYLLNGYSHLAFDSIDYAETVVMSFILKVKQTFKNKTIKKTKNQNEKLWQWQLGSNGGTRYQHFGGINESNVISDDYIHLVFYKNIIFFFFFAVVFLIKNKKNKPKNKKK